MIYGTNINDGPLGDDPASFINKFNSTQAADAVGVNPVPVFNSGSDGVDATPLPDRKTSFNGQNVLDGAEGMTGAIVHLAGVPKTTSDVTTKVKGIAIRALKLLIFTVPYAVLVAVLVKLPAALLCLGILVAGAGVGVVVGGALGLASFGLCLVSLPLVILGSMIGEKNSNRLMSFIGDAVLSFRLGKTLAASVVASACIAVATGNFKQFKDDNEYREEKIGKLFKVLDDIETTSMKIFSFGTVLCMEKLHSDAKESLAE